MLVWLAKLKSEIHEPLFELFRKPRTRGKAANEKCELLMIDQMRCSRISEYTDRVCGKASPEVLPDTVHRRVNRGFKEPSNLRAVCESILSANSSTERVQVYPVNVNLPALIP